MAPKVGSKVSTAKAVKGTVTSPKQTTQEITGVCSKKKDTGSSISITNSLAITKSI